jgi:hypothetical protein
MPRDPDTGRDWMPNDEVPRASAVPLIEMGRAGRRAAMQAVENAAISLAATVHRKTLNARNECQERTPGTQARIHALA